ncbi:hypothetical protein FRC08_015190 [Ceratobasidium sp. 394]|nr:hypothetical protein FRC08_015190 [Ceratobasidium sp. 394]KAG9095810.1 hypothetical protein FS749_009734 [Ceratobasidium sp. UAMH 11750]
MTIKDTESDEPITQGLLLAKPQFLLGTFKVTLAQLQPHPVQRQIDQDWVVELHGRFLEVGVNRADHPVNVLLGPSVQDTQGVLAAFDATLIHTLPPEIPCLVFHGQHRIAACKLLDSQEHWWYAEVYAPGIETSHPAEFLVAMHSGNEEDFRLETTDADRFLVMHRLLEMRRNGTIDKETHSINQRILEGRILKDGTRQGLRNLLRSKELADTIARALEHAHLRPMFNAGTWGKKLVKGRFYSVVVGLIEEMMEQTKLLQGSWHDVPSKPFRLPAHQCAWTQLKQGIKRKNHSWQELEGGAAAAFKRVKSRPPEFVHFMNPRGSDGWMLENMVLLPSGLTSEGVTTCLEDMYVISQHMIHMTAGHSVLTRYTSARPDESETNHPFGIISSVLQDQLRGQSSNYPNKVLHHMWTNRATLLHDLKQRKIGNAESTGKDDYQRLLQDAHSWWQLIRLFKMRVLSKGLSLEVPKEFGGADRGPSTDEYSNLSAGMEAVGVPPSLPPQAPSQAYTSKKREDKSVARDQVVHPATQGPVAAASELGLGPTPLGLLGGTSEVSSRKRHRVERSAEMSIDHEDLDYEDSDEGFIDQAFPYPRVAETPLGKTSSIPALRTYSRLIGQLQQLQNSVPRLQVDETRALGELLEQLNGLQGTGCLPRVAHALSERVQPLTKRARRADQVAKSFDDSEDDTERSDGHGSHSTDTAS